MKLRPYQTEAVNAIVKYFVDGNTGNPIVVLPTGSGKSLCIAEFVKYVMSYPNQRVLMLTHRKELIAQNFEKLITVWPTAPAGIYSAGLGKREINPITFAGIQSAVGKHELFGRIDIICVDEAHLVSNNDETSYRTFINELKLINPYLKVVGFTATPWRIGQGKLTDEGGLFTDIAIDYSSLDKFNWLISEGYLSPLIPNRTTLNIDTENLHIRGGEFITSEVQKAVDKNEITIAALKETLEVASERKCGMIFGAGIEHCEHIEAALKAMGQSCCVVHSKQDNKINDQYIADFKAGKIRWLINNDKLTTGFDCQEVDCIVTLRPTASIVLWCLDEQTEILTDNGFKTINTISPFDKCAAVDKNTLEFSYEQIDGIVTRNLEPFEKMISINKPGVDIRVSDKHNMFIGIKNRTKNKIETKTVSCEKLLDIKSHFIPVSAINKNKNSSGLTKEELIFIGLFLSDGTLSTGNKAISITSSDKYPYVQKELERCLISMGVGYRAYRYVYSETNNFKTKHATMRYSVSYGENSLRGIRKHLRGWKYLEAYLDKNISDLLMNLSTKEFEFLLYGIWLGDGSKYSSPSIDWNPKTFTIALGSNYEYSNRFQELCVKNGYRCNLNFNRSTCIMAHVSKKLFSNINIGYGKDVRGFWKIDDWKAEKIWCVSNKKETLITRRNGKIAVVGNCQMLGRGCRVVYAPGFDLETKEGRLSAIAAGPKQNCLVLDFANNTRRLGPINDPVIPRKRGKGGGTAPIKECMYCPTINHASARFCIACGEEFLFQTKIVEQSSAEELIKGEIPIIETFNVSHVTYRINIGVRGKAPTLLVSYHCGYSLYKEYICLEHEKPAVKAKARGWWRESGGQVPEPTTVEEAVLRKGELSAPKSIRVWVNKQYPEILARFFT